ncbi:DUF6119 family protein [Kribbella italica]|uniref:Uncharacterized protein (TIGR04141 family) n=1 Tax=Kribbella italica TaxID=1540520 RepID=A0A7W9JFJ0_9ACTN|nr:DUF6119 family protein [Kribbella italica]MBB5841191.1 uncharacterized protein (TIGR04141 family) [Kribbella italica]
MRITVYLLRPSVAFAKETLREHNRFKECSVVPPDAEEVEWRLFMNPGSPHDAGWLKHLRPLFAAQPPVSSFGLSPGAVLLVRAHGRVFAVTFGTGFHAIDDAVKEPDFGLLVAANSVDPEQVMLAEARGMGKGRRNALSTLPTPNEMFALGLLTDEEWIRRFGGVAELPGFARTIAGADSLTLVIDEYRLADLPATLGKALELWQADAYKTRFPFLTYFRRVSDKALIAELDDAVEALLCARDPDVGFAVPDELRLTADWYRVARRRNSHDVYELLTHDLFAAIDQVGGWDAPLTAVKVEAYDMNGDIVSSARALRSYVVATVERLAGSSKQQYTLTAGIWFRVDQEYVEQVDRFLSAKIPDLTADLGLPVWDEAFLEANVDGSYGEQRYNTWAGGQFGHAVLDRKLYRGKAGEKVEICDLLTKAKHLICVKRMDGSDKLSHLFQQGSVSALLTVRNDDYQAMLMNKMHELDPTAEFGIPQEWTVVYALATGKPGALKDIMYFFSRAALKMHAEEILSRGFKVGLAKIDRIAGVPPSP